jgi:hypothetical protein
LPSSSMFALGTTTTTTRNGGPVDVRRTLR